MSALRHALLAGCLLAPLAVAAQDLDAAALALADQAQVVTPAASDWRSFVEAGAGSGASRRLSLDLQYEHAVSTHWSVSLADRLDVNWPGRHAINTLKDAFASWRPDAGTMLDAGRINLRNGVALGYNPTDYFGRAAVRSVVSIDPASLKENRQGSTMLRGQKVWDSGSFTAVWAPAQDGVGLAHPARLLLAASQKIGPFAPQMLAYREGAQPTQVGLNVTSLLGDATVAFVEWSGGRSVSQLAATAGIVPLERRWRNQASAGLTYTAPNRLSLTAEYHHDGRGADDAAWDMVRHGPLPLYGLYRKQAQALQVLPTRRELFFHARWQDAFVPRLDLSAMHNVDLIDASRRLWLEARYHAGRFDYALQWQRHRGEALSNYGALSATNGWQVTLRSYF